MASEFLETGNLNIFRTKDAQMLKDIKLGLWSIEEVRQKAKEEEEIVNKALLNSVLPEKPDKESAEQLLMEILRNHIINES